MLSSELKEGVCVYGRETMSAQQCYKNPCKHMTYVSCYRLCDNSAWLFSSDLYLILDFLRQDLDHVYMIFL